MEEQVEMGIKLEKREKRITRIAEAEGIEVYRRAVIVGEVHGWGEPDGEESKRNACTGSLQIQDGAAKGGPRKHG